MVRQANSFGRTMNISGASSMDNKILKAALEYEQKGFSVFPVKSDKKPFVKWEKYQTERAEPDQIREWWKKFPDANVGIITGTISGLDVVDIDSQKGMDAVNELIPDSMVAPVARSPRGGWHHYHEHLEGIGNAARFITDVDLRGDGGYIIAPPSIGENGRAYAWIKGLSIFEVEPCPLPKPLYNIIKASLYRVTTRSQDPLDHKRPQATTGDHSVFKEGMRDEALFHLANVLFKGGMPEANILKYMLFVGSNCTPPFPQKEVLVKIESAKKRNSISRVSIAEEVRDFVMTTSGHFLTTDCHKGPQATTRQEKKAVVMALLRLHEQGVIERYGNKNGCYRRIEEAPPIDFLNASDTPFDILWPFGLENFALIHPKNIIVIAGTQNAGKTAFVLNVTRMNMSRYRGKIRFVSSEMGDSELKGRLRRFEIPLEDWKEVDFREKSSNFSDIIMPDGLNIVDFYEISDKFWLIADDLKRIYDKLNKGIAIVCLQKSPGKNEGRGGDFGLEKPRLYLNLDPDPPDGAILTIRKAKAWAVEGRNPNWYKTRFKIVNGSKLIQQGNWYLETR